MELLGVDEVKRRLEKEILPNPQHPLYAQIKPLYDEIVKIRSRQSLIQLTPEGARRQRAYLNYLDAQIFNIINGLPRTEFVDPTRTEQPVTYVPPENKKAASNTGSGDYDNIWAWAKWLGSAVVVGAVAGVVAGKWKNQTSPLRRNSKKRGKK